MRAVILLFLWPALASAHPCDRPEVVQQVQDGTKATISLCTSDVVTDAILTIDGKKTLVAVTVQPGPANAAGLREYTLPVTFTIGVHKVVVQVVNTTAPIYVVTVKKKGSL